MKALEVYEGSDGQLTKAYYAELEKFGPVGVVALNLFRAQKNSERAKKYRGGIRGQGSYREMAYERKQYAIGELVKVLLEHAATLKITWGWKIDPVADFNCWVLYIDLPQGQVSFHSPSKGNGPVYGGEWDRMKLSCQRILQFCDSVMFKVDERQTLMF